MSKKTSVKTDENIIKLYKQTGNKKSVLVLFDRYVQLIFGLCLKYLNDENTAKDAVFEIFEKLLDDLQKHEVENFKSWLYVYARNYCLMQLRKEKQEKKHIDNFSAENKIPENDIFDIENNNEINKSIITEQLNEALKKLKPEQKECIELFYLQKKCYDEICEITGYNYKKVKSNIQNGKRNLKIKLTEQNIEIMKQA